MSVKKYWIKFWNPSGKGYLPFFLKFLLFSLIAFFIWNFSNDSYNLLLKDVSLNLLDESTPLVDHRFTQKRGQLEILLAPNFNAPIKPSKVQNVAIKIFLNTVHFNLIPFFALILASPFVSWKRLISFFLIGLIILSCFHFIHINLNVRSYYHQEIIRKGVIQVSNARMSPERHHEVMKWLWINRVIYLTQGFMEQAGSMIIPAFIWFVYSSRWILGTILLREKLKSEKAG